MSETQSYAMVSRQKVVDLCDKKIESIKAAREEAQKEMVDELLASNKWWNTYFPFWPFITPLMNEEQARNRLERKWEYRWKGAWYSEAETTAKNLKRLAEITSGGEICLTKGDISKIT